jgi:hypothetical protein
MREQALREHVGVLAMEEVSPRISSTTYSPENIRFARWKSDGSATPSSRPAKVTVDAAIRLRRLSVGRNFSCR